MGTIISIDYSDLSDARSAATKAAGKCDSYIKEIEKKVTNKVSSLTLGSNSNTLNANYFARKKINELHEKKGKYENFANKVKSIKDYAEDTDNRVSRYIKRESKEFRNSHDMKTNVIADFFAWATTTILNSTAFGRWLNQCMKDVGSWIDEKARKFKEWFNLNNGKYILKTVAAIVGTVIAVIFLVCVAWPAMLSALASASIWIAITGVAGVVTAVIAAIDCAIKTGASAAAALSFKDDPGWAKRCSGVKTLSDYLRKTNFKSDFMNKISGHIANVYDIISVVATVINVAELFRTGYKFILKIKEHGGIWMVFDKMSFKTRNGKISFRSFIYGFKRLHSNLKLIKESVTLTNMSRLTSFYEDSMKAYKFVKSVQKIIDFAIDFGDKGAIGMMKEKILDKIKKFTVVWEVGEDAYNTTTDTIDTINRVLNKQHAY